MLEAGPLAPCAGVPDPGRIVKAGGGEPCAIGADCQSNHHILMFQTSVLAACVGVPDPRRIVRAPGCEPLAIRADYHLEEKTSMLQSGAHAACAGVPDAHWIVTWTTSCGEPCAVRADRHGR